jgi:hypothetical protein
MGWAVGDGVGSVGSVGLVGWLVGSAMPVGSVACVGSVGWLVGLLGGGVGWLMLAQAVSRARVTVRQRQRKNRGGRVVGAVCLFMGMVCVGVEGMMKYEG